jgi:hypothetical protein
MFREAIPDPVWKLLLGLSGLNAMRYAYLAGGTALAIQWGIGSPQTWIFFSREDPEYSTLLDEIRKLGVNATVVGTTPHHWELVVDAIKVDCLRERIPLKFPLKTVVSEGGGV